MRCLCAHFYALLPDICCAQHYDARDHRRHHQRHYHHHDISRHGAATRHGGAILVLYADVVEGRYAHIGIHFFCQHAGYTAPPLRR